MITLSVKIDSNLNNICVYKILNKELNISKRLITKLKTNNLIFCNDIPVFTNYVTRTNDIISINIDFDEETNNNIVPFDSKINIIYEDNCILAINKPANMPTHPSTNHYSDTLSNIVKYYYIRNNINKLIRPINRLDKDTTGIVIFAKNQYIQEELINQMKNNDFKKEYICIVNGIFKNNEGIIDYPIARENDSIIKRCINSNGEKAITHYSVIKNIEIDNVKFSILNIKLKTGRTHQIRVHMSGIGHAILGDTLYGKSSKLINRQALHCHKLSFIHPLTKQVLTLTCKIPLDMQKLQL